MFKNIFNRNKSDRKPEESKDSAIDTWLMTSDFVMKALNEDHAEEQINISRLTDFSDALMQGFKHQERLDEQTFKEGLRAECPQCGVRITGEGIMMVSMIKRFDNPVFGGGSKKTARLVDGMCANEECNSKEIVIKWKG